VPGAKPHPTEPAAVDAPEDERPGPASDPGLQQVRARLLARARHDVQLLRPELLGGGGEPRLTLVVLTHDRPEQWPRLLRSLRAHVRLPIKLLVVDDHSQPAARAELRRLCDEVVAAVAGDGDDGGGIRDLELVWLEQSLHCPAARQHAVGLVTTEYLMFLDDDAEIFPGTIEHLVQELDADPAVLVAGAHVVLPDGQTQFCGGEYWEEADGVLHFEPLGMGLDFEDPALGPSRACQWLAGAAMAVRRSALVNDPLDLGMIMYYEDNEWFYRLGRRQPPAIFRRSVHALVLHYQQLKSPREESRDEILRSLPYLQSLAHFYRVHGRILEGIFVFAPRLVAKGRRDTAAARLLVELIAARGCDWLGREWLAGGLAPLFRGSLEQDLETAGSDLAAARAALAAAQAEVAAAHAAAAAGASELAATRQQLTEERERSTGLAAAARQLAAIHQSKLWRFGDCYWRLRRAAARRTGRRD
jgi:GT2 family glycosyltransferase